MLVILFVGHKAFGLWGMLLGVPVSYYFIHDVFGVPIWGEGKVSPPTRPLADLGRSAAGDQTQAAAEAADKCGMTNEE